MFRFPSRPSGVGILKLFEEIMSSFPIADMGDSLIIGPVQEHPSINV